MRAACRDFLTLHSVQAQEHNRGMMRDMGYQQEEFFVGLGKLRAIFGQQLAVLGYLYGVDIEADFATILPPEADNEPRRCYGTSSVMENGAQGRNRTTDTAIFSRMLYQLSYLGVPATVIGLRERRFIVR